MYITHWQCWKCWIWLLSKMVNQVYILNLPSIRTINLQPALFLAWSYTLYRIMFGPSLNSVPGSWPTRITLRRDDNGKPREFCSIWSREKKRDILQRFISSIWCHRRVPVHHGGEFSRFRSLQPGRRALYPGRIHIWNKQVETQGEKGNCYKGRPRLSPEIRRGRNNAVSLQNNDSKNREAAQMVWK